MRQAKRGTFESLLLFLAMMGLAALLGIIAAFLTMEGVITGH